MRESIYENFERRINFLQRKPYRSQIVKEYIDDMKTAVESSYAEMPEQNCENVDVYKWLRHVDLFQIERRNKMYEEVDGIKGRVGDGCYLATIRESHNAATIIDQMMLSTLWLFIDSIFGKEIYDGNDKK